MLWSEGIQLAFVAPTLFYLFILRIITTIGMVVRTLEMKEIDFKVKKSRVDEIAEKIKKINRNLNVAVKGNRIKVSGDLHNAKMKKKILDTLWGESVG